jgi:hypothetical protein
MVDHTRNISHTRFVSIAAAQGRLVVLITGLLVPRKSLLTRMRKLVVWRNELRGRGELEGGEKSG